MGTPKGTKPWNAGTAKGWLDQKGYRWIYVTSYRWEHERLKAINQDLLEALQGMLEQFTKTPSSLKDTEARIKAHAAIRKALGE